MINCGQIFQRQFLVARKHHNMTAATDSSSHDAHRPEEQEAHALPAARSQCHQQIANSSSSKLVLTKGTTTSTTWTSRRCGKHLELALSVLSCMAVQAGAALQICISTSSSRCAPTRRVAQHHRHFRLNNEIIMLLLVSLLLLCINVPAGAAAAYFVGPDYDAQHVQSVVNDLCGRTPWWDTPNLATRCVFLHVCACVHVCECVHVCMCVYCE
jgi:hypothetical protein